MNEKGISEVDIDLLSSKEQTLYTDIAGENELYLFLSENRRRLFYSTDILSLLNSKYVHKPLKVNNEGISFLLQTGVAPPPLTVYKNLFLLNIGDKVTVSRKADRIELNFEHTFPFMNSLRSTSNNIRFDKDRILRMIASAILDKNDRNKDMLLFQSSGKDSNMIALALAKQGGAEKLRCLTLKSKGQSDESTVAAEVCRKLGISHFSYDQPAVFTPRHRDALKLYLKNVPFPTIDHVSLLYPLIWVDLEIADTVLLDGSGNDVYVGHIPPRNEYQGQKYSRIPLPRSMLRSLVSSMEKNYSLLMTRAEWAGMTGFSYCDVKTFYNDAVDVYGHLAKESMKRKNWDYLDLRGDIRGCWIDQQIFNRKLRNFACAYSLDLVLPWTNSAIAKYFSCLPERYMFDRKKLKNKLIFREILKDELELDSDKIGKRGYAFNWIEVLKGLGEFIEDEIYKCELWNREIHKIVNKINKNLKMPYKRSWIVEYLYYRLFVISAWYNNSKYL